MKLIAGISFATLYGLALRLSFGFLDDFMGVMTISFLVLAPMVIGFLTVFFLPGVRHGAAAFFLPWATSAVILVVTVILNIEGTICWIMIYPFFAVLAGCGGLIAYSIKKKNREREDQNPWNNGARWSLPLLMLLPAGTGFLEGDRLLNRDDYTISQSVIIAASPQKVWEELTNINEIPKDKHDYSFSVLMGFPKHVSTTLDTVAIGGKRKAVYEHGLYFDETISQLDPGKKMVLNIHTDPTKIPPTVMDEHILIGGKHCDIEQDIYTLEDIEDGTTRLTLTSTFWINTPFNWYSGIWAEYLMSDILSDEIELVKERAEE